MTDSDTMDPSSGGFEVGEASDRISGDIACLDVADMPAALISTLGFHCEVWRSAGNVVWRHRRHALDLVVKKYRHHCTMRELEVFRNDYRRLKSKLRGIVPAARFVATRVEGRPGAVVIAETVRPWFNLANPANEEEVIPLLKRLGRAREQLERFVGAAKAWHRQTESRVIDLYGMDNLVLDRDYQVRYLDSFAVFFYPDLLHLVESEDDLLRERIRVSIRRREYLAYVLDASR